VKTRRWLPSVLALCLLFAGGVAVALHGQETQVEDEGTEGSDVARPGVGVLGEEIDEFLQTGEDVSAGGADPYDPGERRDPFKSLLVTTDQPALEGPRPEGVPGLLIEEIVLSGIFRTRGGYLAQVQSSDRQKSYLLRKGDHLFDGEVAEISRAEVVFKQEVKDPTALKPFRDVIKSLNP